MSMQDVYLAKAACRPGERSGRPEAIRDHFERINATSAHSGKVRTEAEPKHLDALLQFAARAYRRPLTKAERDDIAGLLSHAARKERSVARRRHPRFHRQHSDVARFLLSHRSGSGRRPAVPAVAQPRQRAAEPLSDYALASRLSYFLWSSMPDQELLHARGGGRSAAARGSAGADAAHAEGRTRRAAWPRSSAATGSISAASKPTTRLIANASPASTTTCARPCSRSPSGSSRT